MAAAIVDLPTPSFARADGDHVLDAGDVAGLGDSFAANLGGHRDMEASISPGKRL